MGDREGVIKYQLNHRQRELSDDIEFGELNAWRSILYALKLIGRIERKYDGLGFGNISRRLVPGDEQFVITCSQTGHLVELTAQHYALIHSASPQHNSIESSGLCHPSSEALTHAGVYHLDPSIQAVIHVHSPELWQSTQRLRLPYISAAIPYGTPAMAEAVTELFNAGYLEALPIFSMLGHEDGIVAFGPCLATAASLLITMLAKARC